MIWLSSDSNQTNQTETTESVHSSRSHSTNYNHLLCTLSPTNLLPTVGYLCFLYAPSSSSVKTPLSSQVGNLVLVPDFNVISSVSVLSMVLSLSVSCCFPSERCGGLLFSTDCVRQWSRCVFLCDTVDFVSVFWWYPLRTLDEFPEKPKFNPFFLLCSCPLALGSHRGLGWELRRLD